MKSFTNIVNKALEKMLRNKNLTLFSRSPPLL